MALTHFIEGDIGEGCDAIIGGGLVAAVVIALIMLFAGLAFQNKDDRVHTYDHRIVSLQDNFGAGGSIHGGLFFVTGFVDTYQFYSWYEEAKDGSFYAEKVSERWSWVKVFELGSNGVPKAVQHIDCTYHTTPNWLAPIDISEEDDCSREEHWELYVPKGTIARNYSLDAQ